MQKKLKTTVTKNYTYKNHDFESFVLKIRNLFNEITIVKMYSFLVGYPINRYIC